jgi:hypothetical protein
VQKKFEALLMTVGCTVDFDLCRDLTNIFHMIALKRSIRMMHRARTISKICGNVEWAELRVTSERSHLSALGSGHQCAGDYVPQGLAVVL